MSADEHRKLEARFLAGSLLFFAILSYFVIKPYFWFLIGGSLLVFSFSPFHKWLKRKTHRPELSAFIAFMVVILVVLGPIVLIGALIFNDARNFVETYDPEKTNETVQIYLEKMHIGQSSIFRITNETIANGEGVDPADDPDADGCNNACEAAHGTDPNDANTDRDHHNDGDEIKDGFNPLVPNGPNEPDSDGDGLTDAQETANGTKADVADTDGDGFSDGLEVRWGSDPKVAGQRPQDVNGNQLPDNFELKNFSSGKSKPGQFANSIAAGMKHLAESLTEGAGEAVLTIIFGFIIAGFVIYYGFHDGDAFYRKVREAIPLPDDIEDKLFNEIRRVTSVVFVGNILISAAGGMFGAITFFVFGIPNAMFWGFVMTIFGILPFVGAPVIWVPAGLWLLLNGHPVKAAIMMGLNLILIVGYLDHILRPKIIAKRSQTHPVTILVGVIGGVEVFGILGFAIGPLVLAIFLALIRAYTEWHPRWRRRKDRGEEPFVPKYDIEVSADAPAAKRDA